MAKPPKELVKQIQIVEGVMTTLNDLIDGNKVKMQHYGKDFQEPLGEVRKLALELRTKLEAFKENMQGALEAQYDTTTPNSRFGSVQKVIDGFLSTSMDKF